MGFLPDELTLLVNIIALHGKMIGNGGRMSLGRDNCFVDVDPLVLPIQDLLFVDL